MEEVLRERLINADSYEEIKSILFEMEYKGLCVEKYLNSIVQRKLISQSKQFEEYNQLLRLFASKNNPMIEYKSKKVSKLDKKIKKKMNSDIQSIVKGLKMKQNTINNYTHNNLYKPYNGGGMSSK